MPNKTVRLMDLLMKAAREAKRLGKDELEQQILKFRDSHDDRSYTD